MCWADLSAGPSGICVPRGRGNQVEWRCRKGPWEIQCSLIVTVMRLPECPAEAGTRVTRWSLLCGLGAVEGLCFLSFSPSLLSLLDLVGCLSATSRRGGARGDGIVPVYFMLPPRPINASPCFHHPFLANPVMALNFFSASLGCQVV
jgi:hypothetical protein